MLYHHNRHIVIAIFNPKVARLPHFKLHVYLDDQFFCTCSCTEISLEEIVFNEEREFDNFYL